MTKKKRTAAAAVHVSRHAPFVPLKWSMTTRGFDIPG
jgi:hypothetical protein